MHTKSRLPSFTQTYALSQRWYRARMNAARSPGVDRADACLATRLALSPCVCASASSSSTRRMRSCCAAEAPSRSRRRLSACCARCRGSRASLLTKHALLDEVWGHQFVSDSVLKTAISDLRTALDDDPRQPRFIETVSRRGYRFIAATDGAAARCDRRRQLARLRADAHRRSAPAFIGRAEALARLRSAWDTRAAASARVVWVAGEPGIGKTTLIEHFVAGLGDVACARGQCVEHYGRGEPYLPVLEALAELCRSDSRGSGSAARRGADLAAAAAVAQHRGGTRSAAAGARRRRPGPHAARDGRAARSLHRAPAAVAGDRGPALERPRDDPAHRLHRAAARQRAPDVACELPSRRGGRAGPSAQPVAARAAPARPVRGDRARSVLRGEVADYVAERSPSLARDEAFVRALHERTDGVPLFVASVITEVIARTAQSGDRRAAGAHSRSSPVPENLAAIIDHYIAKLGDEQRLLLSAAAVCGVEFRVDTLSRALERDAVWVAETCDELVREQLWLVAPRARGRGDAPEQPYSFRHALFRQVLYERTAPSAAHAAAPQGRRRARTGAGRRRHRRRGGARDALRARPRADGSVALLRRGGRSALCCT